jgi:hypothetical protein
MTDQFKEFSRALASAPHAPQSVERSSVRRRKPEAPGDHDQAAMQTRPLPGPVSVLLVVAVSVAGWAVIIMVAARLLR